MNWRAIRDMARSPKDFATIARMAVPVLYADYVRPLLPKTGESIRYNDIIVAEERVLDRLLPKYLTQYAAIESQPEYEDPLIRELRSHVKEGDDVVVVGGGLGVSSTVAAKQTGHRGSVEIYEGSEKHIKLLSRTLALNGVKDRCKIRHAIVGEAKDLRGHPGHAEIVSPTNLPECDVLELDCEGAELKILREMIIEPSAIIVETHANHGAPASDIVKILRDRGYVIEREQTANRERGIDIVTAIDDSGLSST